MQRTQIYLPKEQLIHLKNLAYKERITLSEKIRLLIATGLQKRPNKKNKSATKEPKTAGEFLLSLAKLTENTKWDGPSDLSENHDKYIYGI